uniref:Metalloendopeptidase n=1 Tax=Plectus sambesii TaxID=2011161 RepID=A0A914VHC2_9BILA
MYLVYLVFLSVALISTILAQPPPGFFPPPGFNRWQNPCRFRPRHPRCRGFRGPGNGGFGPGPGPEGPPPPVPIPVITTPDPLAGVPDGLRAFVPQLPKLSAEDKKSILNICATTGGCKAQSADTVAKRDSILQQEVERLKATKPNAQNELQQQFDMTHAVKQALLFDAELSNDVVAANDGTFQDDTMLTIAQAAAMLGTSASSRAKRYALFFEAAENTIKKWDISSPIQYLFDNKFADTEKATIKQGLQDIMKKTCLRFEEATALPGKPHIFYQKANGASYCGLSYVGVVDPQNVVYLNFGSPTGCKNMLGVAAHETMHALGVTHQQNRRDRDKFLTINWNNINPQNYDYFAIPDAAGGKTYTDYGVPYDYYSVMHYTFNTAAVDVTKATMTPKIKPDYFTKILGQREGISDRDAELLRKMYCMPDCVDKNVWCGYWALEDRCMTGDYVDFMIDNCQKSCDFCPGQANTIAKG